MTNSAKSPLFLGWDVGGWNCDKNANSRDAIVVLDGERNLLGTPWRGNLRSSINEAMGADDWIAKLLSLCDVDSKTFAETPVTIGIDTPLGFSTEFIELVANGKATNAIEASSSNPYLFRHTERFLFERGLTPLSAIKDMIGSQATKGIHALSRFAPHIRKCGVWTDRNRLTVIEAYPSACKSSTTMRELEKPFIEQMADESSNSRYFPGFDHSDHQDALVCALIAWLFQYQPDKLCQPSTDAPIHEGWIFAPEDGLN